MEIKRVRAGAGMGKRGRDREGQVDEDLIGGRLLEPVACEALRDEKVRRLSLNRGRLAA